MRRSLLAVRYSYQCRTNRLERAPRKAVRESGPWKHDDCPNNLRAQTRSRKSGVHRRCAAVLIRAFLDNYTVRQVETQVFQVMPCDAYGSHCSFPYRAATRLLNWWECCLRARARLYRPPRGSVYSRKKAERPGAGERDGISFISTFVITNWFLRTYYFPHYRTVRSRVRLYNSKKCLIMPTHRRAHMKKIKIWKKSRNHAHTPTRPVVRFFTHTLGSDFSSARWLAKGKSVGNWKIRPFGSRWSRFSLFM